MSTKRALAALGVGQIYHMHEVFLHPDHMPLWAGVPSGSVPDWHSLFAGYVGTLDFPACLFWEELAAAFPRTKILLLQRDPEKWYQSMHSTIYQIIKSPKWVGSPGLQLTQDVFFDWYMDGKFDDQDYAIQKYSQYCENVRITVPADRLFVYEVSDGWGPLCSLFECEVPDVAFPNQNTREQFRTQL